MLPARAAPASLQQTRQLFHSERALGLAGEELPDELVVRVEQLLAGPDSTIRPFQRIAMYSATCGPT